MSREYRGGDYGTHYDIEDRHRGPHFGPKCPGCGIYTEASEGYVCWVPDCPCRGLDATSRESTERAARAARGRLSGRSANLDGAEALRQLGGGRMSGQVAADYLDRLDELERRSQDLELLDAYEAALGVRLGGVGHEPGWPP